MPCQHRFINDLLPEYPLKYLFVGTFNPEWDRPNDNANWFYGRQRNSFWKILPGVFEGPNLYPQRLNPEVLKTFCINRSIGISDIIRNIPNAEINNPAHVSWISKVKDKDLERFNVLEATSIEDLILRNKKTLMGVYLTRYQHTLPIGNPTVNFPNRGFILNQWNHIVETCNQSGIHHSDLVTPSNGYFVLNVEQKIQHWREHINV